MSSYFVIFGAAVCADGSASGSLRRRIEGALELARAAPQRTFVATGGVGRHGPAEAQVIRDLLLASGTAPHEILIEDEASDTLESVLLCDQILRGRSDIDVLIPCSSNYHNPRCALLFRLLGYKVQVRRMLPDRLHLGWRLWALYVLKECIVLPYDALLLLWRTRVGNRRSARQ